MFSCAESPASVRLSLSFCMLAWNSSFALAAIIVTQLTTPYIRIAPAAGDNQLTGQTFTLLPSTLLLLHRGSVCLSLLSRLSGCLLRVCACVCVPVSLCLCVCVPAVYYLRVCASVRVTVSVQVSRCSVLSETVCLSLFILLLVPICFSECDL